MSIDQVNDVVFHPEKEYFVGSCSSSGTISFCNTSSKKKTKSFKYSDKWPVACMDLNRDATLMAAVMGNDYHEGWEGREKYLHPNLILRKTNSSSFSASYGSTSYGSYGSGRGGTSTGGGYGYSRYWLILICLILNKDFISRSRECSKTPWNRCNRRRWSLRPWTSHRFVTSRTPDRSAPSLEPARPLWSVRPHLHQIV